MATVHLLVITIADAGSRIDPGVGLVALVAIAALAAGFFLGALWHAANHRQLEELLTGHTCNLCGEAPVDVCGASCARCVDVIAAGVHRAMATNPELDAALHDTLANRRRTHPEGWSDV
jgi:hypothetical protein